MFPDARLMSAMRIGFDQNSSSRLFVTGEASYRPPPSASSAIRTVTQKKGGKGEEPDSKNGGAGETGPAQGAGGCGG